MTSIGYIFSVRRKMYAQICIKVLHGLCNRAHCVSSIRIKSQTVLRLDLNTKVSDLKVRNFYMNFNILNHIVFKILF